jgi:competence protein ComEC
LQAGAADGAGYAGATSLPGGAAAPGAFARFKAVLSSSLAAEQDRWLPWCVAAFGAGIAIYFSLTTEPSVRLTALVGVALLVCAVRPPASAGTAMRFLCAVVAAGGLGFAAAKVRTLRVDAPVITRDTGPVEVIGRIESLTVMAPNKARIVLAPSKLGKDGATPPRLVRLTLSGAKAVAAVHPGAVVTALAMLRPPPEPAMPHGYDFARWAFFHGIGGSVSPSGAPKPVEAASPPGSRTPIG